MNIEIFSSENINKGLSLNKSKKIGPVLFSEGTYQIRVTDKKHYWPFLQISDDGVLKDHFCTCSEAEKKESCSHQAAAWLFIFNGHLEPLHVRFRESLWNKLGEIGARRHNYHLSGLQKVTAYQFQAFSLTKKKLFSIKGLTTEGKQILKDILIDRKSETEETSLKFSNLSSEELSLWKQGNPSHFLKYELSFWSDLAKWWMILQEKKEKYKIDFIYEQAVLPKAIEVTFKDVSFFFYLAEANWKQLIPALVTVESPLKTHEWSVEKLHHISYNYLTKSFSIELKPGSSKETSVNYPIGEWNFVPGKGFYPYHLDPLLNEKEIQSEQVEDFLDRYSGLIKKYLLKFSINPMPVPIHYQLSFNSTYDLLIQSYLFTKGDLQKPHSHFFGKWVYLDGDGFYRIENPLFEGKEKKILFPEVSDFISSHRNWLNHYPDFQTHLASMDAQLTYQVDPKGLHFIGHAKLGGDSGEDLIDFDEWVYIKEKGFYPKSVNHVRKVVSGLTIALNDISSFIEHHQEELENIDGFFSHQSPILSSGLELRLNESQKIIVSPVYTFLNSYLGKKVVVFDQYTYVDQEGFFEIPAKFRLPERYLKEQIIEKNAELIFISYEIETLKPFLLHIDSGLQKPQYLSLKVNSLEQDTKGYFLVDLRYESDLGSIDVLPVWQALNENKKYLFSSAGLLFFKSPRYNWLKSISSKRWGKNHRYLKLTTLEWMRLSVLENIVESSNSLTEKIVSPWEKFKTFTTKLPLNIEGLKSELRTYQKAGLQWLWFLYSEKLSGLLCDDMGLGKTHQAMALIAAVSNFSPQSKFLVVCPTSVIFHWEELLKQFLPSLRIYVYYGSQRTLTNFHELHDLLLTSYGTLRNEKKIFAKTPFQVAIFDEIQIAKNSSSQTHRSLKQIDAPLKIGLTGTPIENNLLELHSLFNIILPGYLPSDSLYKELFINPIEKHHDSQKKQLLTRLVKPFILRRKKSDVLLELPEKTETLAYAALSEEQKQLYNEVYQSSKEQLFKELSDDSQPVPYLHVFSLLTKLKQICNHPALYYKKEQNYQKYSSGKWDLFIELLYETRESKQKLVVFSQYLGMLDIIENFLERHQIGFASIRGSTKDRKQQVSRFRDDPNCEIFIGSLQAAGVGIDLVSASVVIHYDRWWNPAKENQATDRVHRIGQNRGVQVFKLISKGTIEEHIHRLIEKKLGLIDSVIGYDKQDQLKSLSREDLMEMLSLMALEQAK